MRMHFILQLYWSRFYTNQLRFLYFNLAPGEFGIYPFFISYDHCLQGSIHSL